MKRIITIIILIICLSSISYGHTRFRLHSAFHLIDSNTVEQVNEQLTNFKELDHVILWGLGWEVIFSKIGFGGTYMVDFIEEDINNDWWLDWNGDAFYLSYHILGGSFFVDPFIELGLGCAGRIYLGYNGSYNFPENLYISVYPFITGGLAFQLDGFLISGKLKYLPDFSPLPVTPIEEYPLKNFQFSLNLGFAF